MTDKLNTPVKEVIPFPGTAEVPLNNFLMLYDELRELRNVKHNQNALVSFGLQQFLQSFLPSLFEFMHKMEVAGYVKNRPSVTDTTWKEGFWTVFSNFIQELGIQFIIKANESVVVNSTEKVKITIPWNQFQAYAQLYNSHNNPSL